MYYSVYNVKTAKLIYTADSIEKCENKIHELEAQAKLNGLFIPDSFAVYCEGGSEDEHLMRQILLNKDGREG